MIPAANSCGIPEYPSRMGKHGRRTWRTASPSSYSSGRAQVVALERNISDIPAPPSFSIACTSVGTNIKELTEATHLKIMEAGAM